LLFHTKGRPSQEFKEGKLKKTYASLVFILLFSFLMMQYASSEQKAAQQSDMTFEISFPKDVVDQIKEFNLQVPITGRVYAIISRNNEKELRFQTGYTGVPIWGKNVYSLKPGEGAIIDEDVFGYPLKSIRDIPPGDYYVQGFINIYTEFKRSDGNTIWMHQDQWEGQHWNISPGNIYSDVKKVHIDPTKAESIKISCSHVIPRIEIPPDTKWVKRIKFKSKILTDFWGQPMYIGATILLPKGYDEHPDVYYPVNYIQGHFSLRAPHGFRTEPPSGEDPRGRQKSGYEFYKYWISDECPRMITVTFQHPCPYFDDSYAINGPNVGPYGDALLKDLLPKIEENFRIIRKPYARLLSGGSTGGWESFALQLFYPDFFGGTWTGCPDPIDFRRFQVQNIYEQPNMYYTIYEWMKVEIPETRSTDGDISFMMKDRCHYELVIGDKNRSGLQWAIWNAVYTPVGEDGYPKDLWDWMTGEINPEVAEEWKKYDLSLYLRENWSWLGPKLVGKLHLYTGDMDNAYLNLGVVLVEEFLKKTKNPYYDGVVKYGDRGPHCWMPRGKELCELFEEHLLKYAPPGEETSKWRY